MSGGLKKIRLAAVAALGHVMRMARNDNAGEACHGGIVVASGNQCNG